MNKTKKIIVFIWILVICGITMIVKENLSSKEEVYVLSSSKEEESIVSDEVKKEENISNEKITVYISGQVKNPGVVTLNQGDRLARAVEEVGGPTEDADMNQINLAIKVEDEMHYIIPEIGEQIEGFYDTKETSQKTENNNSKININTATIEELEELPGVGEATANKIVNYRNENGEFKSIEEIKNVNGIGDKKYDDMKDLIDI